jgi:hypothetical protein
LDVRKARAIVGRRVLDAIAVFRFEVAAGDD